MLTKDEGKITLNKLLWRLLDLKIVRNCPILASEKWLDKPKSDMKGSTVFGILLFIYSLAVEC